LEDLFDYVRIVPGKDAATFRALAADLGMRPGSCWVVGDSLKSDIIPAVTAGFRAIHVAAPNWGAYEHAGLAVPAGAVAVANLSEALAIIAR
jgi:putative hydrolase of the HAD superfamily